MDSSFRNAILRFKDLYEYDKFNKINNNLYNPIVLDIESIQYYDEIVRIVIKYDYDWYYFIDSDYTKNVRFVLNPFYNENLDYKSNYPAEGDFVDTVFLEFVNEDCGYSVNYKYENRYGIDPRILIPSNFNFLRNFIIEGLGYYNSPYNGYKFTIIPTNGVITVNKNMFPYCVKESRYYNTLYIEAEE